MRSGELSCNVHCTLLRPNLTLMGFRDVQEPAWRHSVCPLLNYRQLWYRQRDIRFRELVRWMCR